MRSVLAICGRLALCNRLSFLLTALVVLCATSSGDTALSNGNYTWLLALLCPFFVVLYAFPKLLCLGASKRDFCLGSLVFYALLALGAVVSVFTPIAPLRALLADLFRLVLCNPNALTHLCACLLLSAALALVGLWALKQKTL